MVLNSKSIKCSLLYLKIEMYIKNDPVKYCEKFSKGRTNDISLLDNRIEWLET